VSITAYVTGEAAARASALPKTQPASAVLISIRRPKTPATRNKGENVEREKAVRAATKAIVFPFSDAAANIRVHGTYTALLRAKWRGRSRRESQRLSLAYRIILARDKIEIRPVRFISAGAKLVLSSLETYRCKRVTLIGIRDEFVGLPPPPPTPIRHLLDKSCNRRISHVSISQETTTMFGKLVTKLLKNKTEQILQSGD